MGVRRVIGCGLAVLLLSAGCSSSEPGRHVPPDVVLDTTRVDPAADAVCAPPLDLHGGASTRVCVGRADGDLLVTTWGSSSCARVPQSVAAPSATKVDVVIGSLIGLDGSCTADESPTTSRVALPDGADAGAALTVEVSGTGLEATVTLPAP